MEEKAVEGQEEGRGTVWTSGKGRVELGRGRAREKCSGCVCVCERERLSEEYNKLCNIWRRSWTRTKMLCPVYLCCNVLYCVAVCCSVLQCVEVWWSLSVFVRFCIHHASRHRHALSPALMHACILHSLIHHAYIIRTHTHIIHTYRQTDVLCVHVFVNMSNTLMHEYKQHAYR